MSGWNTDFKSKAPNTIKVPHDDVGRTQADGRAILQTRIAALLPDDEKAEPAREKLTRAEALSKIEAKLERMPEDDRLAYVTQERWSDEARKIVEEAYVNTMGTLPTAADEYYVADDPSEDFNARDDGWADLTVDFRDEAYGGEDE